MGTNPARKRGPACERLLERDERERRRTSEIPLRVREVIHRSQCGSRDLTRETMDSAKGIVIQWPRLPLGGKMGSSGSGKISDYPGSSPSGDSGGEGGGGNAGAEDRCAKAFSARLEDVEQSEYYRNHGRIPPVGTQVEVAMRKRPVAQTIGGGKHWQSSDLLQLHCLVHEGRVGLYWCGSRREKRPAGCDRPS